MSTEMEILTNNDIENLSKIPNTRKEIYEFLSTLIPKNKEMEFKELTNQENSVYLDIAYIIMKFWSKAMKRNAEKLILNYAVKKNYFNEEHLNYIVILSGYKFHSPIIYDENDITNKDTVIFNVLWFFFGIKDNFEQIKSHRFWVKNAFLRIKNYIYNSDNFVEKLEKIIDRHDLTKFSLEQSIGYTLKFIHSKKNLGTLDHSIDEDKLDFFWKISRNIHIYNEPHHPQVWNDRNMLDKKMVLENWFDDYNKMNYFIDMKYNILKEKKFMDLFLYESYIDMVGVEWERNEEKKDPNISNAKLFYIEDKFFSRYSNEDKFVLQKFSNYICTK